MASNSKTVNRAIETLMKQIAISQGDAVEIRRLKAELRQLQKLKKKLKKEGE